MHGTTPICSVFQISNLGGILGSRSPAVSYQSKSYWGYLLNITRVCHLCFILTATPFQTKAFPLPNTESHFVSLFPLASNKSNPIISIPCLKSFHSPHWPYRPLLIIRFLIIWPSASPASPITICTREHSVLFPVVVTGMYAHVFPLLQTFPAPTPSASPLLLLKYQSLSLFPQ